MIVMIDNFDSFTFNLYQYFAQLDSNVQVYRAHSLTAQDVLRQKPDLVVLAPGPGSPEDAVTCRHILHALQGKVPIFGVCLGHQVIVEHFGGTVIKGTQPMHGKVTAIKHDGRGLFEQLPSPISVTRYHSLTASRERLPGCLDITAATDTGEIMAVRHRDWPIASVQFHPEAILTEFGFEMIQNMYRQALEFEPKEKEPV
ncbi:aminodeoxychorismate/anthranilate synthase component II [Thalassobacillus sp. CUG 92003]|uniref:anthranilate synthase component II n=1 Tax=Thalassobacillus sp. CUG 92003 TaxID=2736641 RepID=UPI0015E64912|nr:aminodeoxychorismate/anthranilate synthase component II [Thalassobacillus sp. CUG 92003]